MKKTRLLVIIGVAILITAGLALLGNYFINQRAQSNLSEIGALEELLDDIDSSDGDYIDDSYSDFSDNYEFPANITPTVQDKSTALTDADEALSSSGSTGLDESGGFNIDFGSL